MSDQRPNIRAVSLQSMHRAATRSADAVRHMVCSLLLPVRARLPSVVARSGRRSVPLIADWPTPPVGPDSGSQARSGLIGVNGAATGNPRGRVTRSGKRGCALPALRWLLVSLALGVRGMADVPNADPSTMGHSQGRCKCVPQSGGVLAYTILRTRDLGAEPMARVNFQFSI